MATAGTILVVDDDRSILLLATRFLRGAGFSVLEAAHGPEALEICRGHPGPIDLLLTDQTLPGMKGDEVARAALKIRSLKVLVLSGNPFDPDIVGSGLPFMEKPFDVRDLIRVVRERLGEVQSTRPAGPQAGQ